MQRIFVGAAGAEVGRAVALQAAAAHQLVKTFEPTQTAGIGERHELRMHRTFDRRLPADVRVAQPGLPQAHAARGHDGEAELAVVDFDRVDALAHSATERAAFDASSPATLRLSKSASWSPRSESVRTRICCAIAMIPPVGGRRPSRTPCRAMYVVAGPISRHCRPFACQCRNERIKQELSDGQRPVVRRGRYWTPPGDGSRIGPDGKPSIPVPGSWHFNHGNSNGSQERQCWQSPVARARRRRGLLAAHAHLGAAQLFASRQADQAGPGRLVRLRRAPRRHRRALVRQHDRSGQRKPHARTKG